MKKRVWLYLRPSEAELLDSIGLLTGCTTRHSQIEFIVKTFRLLVPDPTLISPVVSRLFGNFDITLKEETKRGPSERAWVYLGESDLAYIDALGEAIGETARSRTILYMIRLFRPLLLNAVEVSKLVRKMLEG